jgi:mono/diheme cytochrome c family protein
MTRRLLGLATVVGFGPLILTGQRPAPPAVYTAAQAETGRAAYLNTCARCHTASLKGRVGNPDETPPVSSLPGALQQIVRKAGGRVPPLVGASFMKHWEAKTTKDLSECVQGTLSAFFHEKDAKTSLAITAYILQSNGARPGEQELTDYTAAVLSALTASTAYSVMPPARQDVLVQKP